ncbi:tetratricopeptide repeat protein [Phycicoccus sp. BSK3Z-2]|uniref:Tetratricopeptide repeat protein n=1 Tax=Phycicoccus avicenniae TaxID=2828860 RepID=A0A941D8X9_9MICO|nr:tetratricopeptide repeat protein [Phycicoccus avicenniae]MBR7744284.1 tetratricopeptide repeat protein [Phycicoccus avicenniae]
MTSTSSIAERYEQARGLYRHGEYQEAASLLSTLVDESLLAPPLHGTTELRLLLARAYFHSAQLGRSERVTRAVLADDPDEPYANLLLGRTLQRQGRAGEARPHLAMAELLGGYAGDGRLEVHDLGPGDPGAASADGDADPDADPRG